jgi:hypothetical protein
MVENLIIGIVSGVISGLIVSLYFYFKAKEEQWNDSFVLDKQKLNRYLEAISFELGLIIEDMDRELPRNTLLYFRRLLLQDPFTFSFGDENLDSQTLEPVLEARKLINDLQGFLEEEKFDKFVIKDYQSRIFQLRSKIVR